MNRMNSFCGRYRFVKSQKEPLIVYFHFDLISLFILFIF